MGKHDWNPNCSHGSWSMPTYGRLAHKLYRCEGQNCGQVSVVCPSSRDENGWPLRSGTVRGSEPMRDISDMDTPRNRLAARLCNWILTHVADEGYSRYIGGAIRYGMRSAAEAALRESRRG